MGFMGMIHSPQLYREIFDHQFFLEMIIELGGGFLIFFIFTPKLGEDEPNLTSIFFKGVGEPTTN